MRDDFFVNEAVLDNLIDQLRSPLLTIKLMLESQRTNSTSELVTRTVELIDDIQYLREAYKLRPALNLQPLNLKVFCEQTAHGLATYAASKGVEVEVGRVLSLLAVSNQTVLQRAYSNMVLGLISQSPTAGQKIILEADSTAKGLRLGAYCTGTSIEPAELKRLSRNFYETRRPSSMDSRTPMVELFLADRLLSLINLKYRTAISRHRRGLATVLLPSRQLGLLT